MVAEDVDDPIDHMIQGSDHQLSLKLYQHLSNTHTIYNMHNVYTKEHIGLVLSKFTQCVLEQRRWLLYEESEIMMHPGWEIIVINIFDTGGWYLNYFSN